MKLKKLLSVLLAVVIIASLGAITVSAESVKIATDAVNPSLNKEFTITITFSGAGLGSIDAVITYDANRLEMVSLASDSSNPNKGELVISHYNANGFTSKSFEYKFKAIAEGDAKIAVISSEVWTADTSTKYTPTASTVVKVVDKANLSGNANLKAMALSDDIPLNPEFNKDVTTYNVTVDNSVEKVLINALPEDKNAKITYGGSTRMKVGDNQRWVIVTAPNGTQKKYTINIKRNAPNESLTNTDTPTINPYEIKIGEETWLLVYEYPDELKLDGFTVASAMINGYELPVLKSDVTQEVVVYAKLVSEEERAAYFVYNPFTTSFKEYCIYSPIGSDLVLLELDSDIVLPKGYYKTNTNVGGYNLEVIKYNDEAFADFVIVYAQSAEGHKDYYRIDLKNNTAQRFPDFTLKLKMAQTMSKGTITARFMALSSMEKVMVCASVVILFLIVVLIIVLLVRLIRGIAYKRAEMVNELDELEEYDDFVDDEEFSSDDEEFEDEEFKEEDFE